MNDNFLVFYELLCLELSYEGYDGKMNMIRVIGDKNEMTMNVLQKSKLFSNDLHK